MTQTPSSRITVQTVIRTPETAYLRREDVTEFLAACHRHDVPADGAVSVEVRGEEPNRYFRLVATKTIEQGTL